ncbi:MAG: hypothetical protein ABSG91_16160 [Syntrophobacteraceae bacterium]
MRNRVGYLLKILSVSLFLLLYSSPDASAAQAQLAWNQSTVPSIIGYKVYYGTHSRNYPFVIDAGANLSYTVTGLSGSLAYYFAVTAYTKDTESGFSQELICYLITAATSPSGQITPAGTTALTRGGSQTYSIVPNPGYKISDVLLDGVSIGPVSQYTFSNLSACHTIAANFTSLAANYTISASTQGSGSISPSGTVSISPGTSRTFTITPAANYKISDVKVDNASVGALSSYTFTKVAANHTIAATFSPISTCTISATVQGSGSISPSGTVSVPSGTSRTFTITPAANYKISNVKVDNALLGALSSYTFTNVAANHTIAATFSPIPTYTISATVQGSGSISPSGTVSVPSGTSRTLAITPASNYKISAVKVDGRSIGAVSSYTFTNVTANHNIAAAFAPIKYTISASVQGAGSITPPGTKSVLAGTDSAYTITPAPYYKLSDVLVDGKSYGAVSGKTSTGAVTYSFKNVGGDHTIHAIFFMIPPPVADAGPDQDVKSGSKVTLSGSNSTDSLSGIASYKWTQTFGPPVKLSNPSAPGCSFAAPNIASGRMLAFNLAVTNKAGITKSSSCLVNVSATDRAPSANAGADQTVYPYTNVTLDGSGSFDPDGSIATYRWVQIKGPHVEISNVNTTHASFVAPNPGPLGASLVFSLQVTDHFGLTTRDQCTVNVVNADQPPVADAGPDQTAAALSSVTLDASGSYDPVNSTESYRWKQIRGVPVTLSDPTAKNPLFIAPADTNAQSANLLFLLTVTDAQDGLSATAKCAVAVKLQ